MSPTGAIQHPRPTAPSNVVSPATAGGGRDEAALTSRELQIYRLCGTGQSTRGIAAGLGISAKTVESHRENIKNKLGLDSHAALLARAARWVRANPAG